MSLTTEQTEQLLSEKLTAIEITELNSGINLRAALLLLKVFPENEVIRTLVHSKLPAGINISV